MKKTAFIGMLALSVLLTGCATPQKYDAKLNEELGKTASELMASFGQPSRTRRLADGNEIISYINVNYQIITDPNYFFNTGFMTEDEIFTPFTIGETEIPVGNFMGETITDYCKTDFYLTNGIVTSWQWRGNSCVAL